MKAIFLSGVIVAVIILAGTKVIHYHNSTAVIEAEKEDTISGAELYRINCAGCHA